jgi:hypothetical protein
VEAAEPLRARIAATPVGAPSAARRSRPGPRSHLRGRTALSAAGAALVAAAVVAGLVIVGGPGGGGVESASAAVRHAARATAESAGSSGSVTVEITHGGELWAGKTVRWHGDDLAVLELSPGRQDGCELLVVDAMMYGCDDEGRWVELGRTGSIDPDSGTTPDELLAATQADLSGDTLDQIAASMAGLTTQPLADGSTVYRGTVPAGLVAPEGGFKEGQRIRVFPWGYVAHDEAANPDALLDAAITVDADGLISELLVTWGSWAYTVVYRDLGSTEPIVAPENAQQFPGRSPAAPPTGVPGNDG